MNPEDSDKVPEDSEASPEDSDTVPEDSEASPEDSNKVPEDSEVSPEDSSHAPWADDSLSEVDDSDSTPQHMAGLETKAFLAEGVLEGAMTGMATPPG